MGVYPLVSEWLQASDHESAADSQPLTHVSGSRVRRTISVRYRSRAAACGVTIRRIVWAWRLSPARSSACAYIIPRRK